MLNLEERQAAEIDDLRKARDEYQAEKHELRERLIAVVAFINSPVSDEQLDVAAFGRDAWVYCREHVKPHQAGWCSVAVYDKIGLGVATAKEAYAKCEAWGLKIHDPNASNTRRARGEG